MPAVPLVFRAKCGCFVAVFCNFMLQRALKKERMRQRTLKPRNRADGVIVGLTLTVIFFSNLLMQCGDVESNPGPPKTRQTSCSGSRGGSLDRYVVDTSASVQSRGRGEKTTAETTEPPILTDVMTMLSSLNSQFANMDAKFTSMDSKFDDMKNDIREIKDSYSELKGEVQALSEEITSLREENNVLKDSNRKLHDSVKRLEEKTDDLECRSKRNNLIIHGIPRLPGETPENCEQELRDMLTDKMDLGDDFSFDRVHRVNSKSDSPIIARCTYYRQKMNILKAKGKLRGTILFVGEDFSLRVRNIRRKLAVHLRAAKAAKKRATMIFDHLLIEGKRYVLGDDESSIVEVR